MVWAKKAQSGAAILVGLLAVMIIMYVLFLPPADRAALLGEPGKITPGQTQPGNTLYTATVGRVYPAIQPTQTHNLPGLAIRAIEAGTVLTRRDTVTVKNNIFEKQPATIVFSADPAITKNAVLSMSLAAKTGGNIIIVLNNQELFNQEISSRSIPPIPLSNLQETNTLTFLPSTVGFSFWKSNTYTFADVKVTADVTDISGATAKQRFTISPEEFMNLNTATFTFVPICSTEGRIQLFLNDIELYSGVPDCGSLNSLELAPTRLQPGENTITFSTRDADIIIDRASIVTLAKQQQNRVYTFDVNAAAVQGKQVSLNLLFSDGVAKRGTIILNGRTLPFFAESTFTASITNTIKAGQNTMQFQALDKDFEIVKFDVVLN